MNHDGLLGHGQVLMTLSIDVGLTDDFLRPGNPAHEKSGYIECLPRFKALPQNNLDFSVKFHAGFPLLSRDVS